MINKEELFNPEEVKIDYENMSKEELINLIKLEGTIKGTLHEMIIERDAVIRLMAKHIVKYGKLCVENYGANEDEWIKYFYEKVEGANE